MKAEIMSPAAIAAVRPDAQTPAKSTVKSTLQSLRGELDVIDTELLALIARRQGVARRIGEAKGAAAPGLKLRPDRETEVLRRVDARAAPENRRCVEALWREVMSAGLSVQGQVEVAVWSGARRDAPALARGRFGGSADYRQVATPAEALAAAEQHGVAVLALDPDTAWWAELPEREDLWVFDALGRRGPTDPAVLAVGRLDAGVLARGVSYRVSVGGDSGGEGRAERLIAVGQGRRLYAVADHGRGVLDRARGVIGCAPQI
jgi:chorismate mutase/prephenate dehydratase